MDAYLPLDVQMVTGARVTRVAVQPGGGRFALIAREEVTSPDAAALPNDGRTAGASLLLYDGRSGRTFTLLTQNAEQSADGTVRFQGVVLGIVWLGGSDQALLTSRVTPMYSPKGAPTPPTVFSLHLVEAGRHIVRPLLSGPDPIQVFTAPGGGTAALIATLAVRGETGSPGKLRTLSARGILSEPLPVTTTALSPDDWDAEGMIAYFRGEGSVWSAVDTRTGRVTAVQSPPAPPRAPAAAATVPAVRLKSSSVVARQGQATRTLHPLWLSSAVGETPFPVWLAADADQSFLLSDGSAVLYSADGALYARRLRRMPRRQFDALQADAYRTQALADAFSIGVALQRYAADHGGAYPQAGADLTAILAPYTRNPDALKSALTYTFAGGKPTGDGPAELGYVKTDTGRAVLDSRGDSNWQP
jgi:hypothetical protein